MQHTYLRLKLLLVDGEQRATGAGMRSAEDHHAASRLRQHRLQLRLVYLP